MHKLDVFKKINTSIAACMHRLAVSGLLLERAIRKPQHAFFFYLRSKWQQSRLELKDCLNVSGKFLFLSRSKHH